ncbi:hypothetical protein Tco_1307685, partial [Tanacetum coccineum]
SKQWLRYQSVGHCKNVLVEWVDMMVLYCQNAAAVDREYARRINALLQEMVVAYDERVDFIWEMEFVPGVVAAVKTAEFLNENL